MDAWLPRLCARPSTIPPTSVPHSEPRPPMTTASKANSRIPAPAVGENDVRAPRKNPASAMAAKAMAMATP